MNPARRNFHAFIYLFLTLPCFVSAQEREAATPVSEGLSAGNVPLQLAAAIGIIRSEPSAPPQVEEPIEPPVQPENQTSPPVVSEPVESPIASDNEEPEQSEPSGISRTKIWIGVGVAALLGVVAGGSGGGGGSSSTPQH